MVGDQGVLLQSKWGVHAHTRGAHTCGVGFTPWPRNQVRVRTAQAMVWNMYTQWSMVQAVTKVS